LPKCSERSIRLTTYEVLVLYDKLHEIDQPSRQRANLHERSHVVDWASGKDDLHYEDPRSTLIVHQFSEKKTTKQNEDVKEAEGKKLCSSGSAQLLLNIKSY
jgi:hypothetical protein